jgi:hypothetical protein
MSVTLKESYMHENDDQRLSEILENQNYIIEILHRNQQNSIKLWKLSFGVAAILASIQINNWSHEAAVIVFVLGVLLVILSPVALKKIDDFFLSQ